MKLFFRYSILKLHNFCSALLCDVKKNTGDVLCEVGVLVVSAGTCRLQSAGFATASLVLLYHQSQGGVCLTLPFAGEVAISPQAQPV